MKVMMNWSLPEALNWAPSSSLPKLFVQFSKSPSTTATQGSCPLGEESKLALTRIFIHPQQV